MDLWARVREKIAGQNTTQEWLSGKVGVHAVTFRRWMSKKIMPNADQAVAIAQALGTSVEELVTGEDRRLPPERLRPIIRDLAILDDADLQELEAIIAVKLSRYREESKHA